MTWLVEDLQPFWRVLRHQLEVPEQGHCSGKLCSLGERADSDRGLATQRDNRCFVCPKKQRNLVADRKEEGRLEKAWGL